MNRIFLFDNLKFILIYFVVLGHFMQTHMEISIYKSLWIFIYAFHMPAFFMIAGYFHKNEDVSNKVMKFFMYGIIIKIILSLTKFVLMNKISFTLFSEKDLPWFMYVMGFHVLLMYLFRSFDKKIILLFSVVLSMFIGFDKNIGDFLCLSRTIIFFPFYVMGSMISREFLERLNFYKLRSICFLAFWLVICIVFSKETGFLGGFFTGRNPFPVKIYPYGPLIRLLTFFISTLLCFSLLSLISKKRIYYISDLGSKTIQVYLWHRVFLYIFTSLHIDDIVLLNYFGLIAWGILALLITLITSMSIFKYPFTIISSQSNVLRGKDYD